MLRLTPSFVVARLLVELQRGIPPRRPADIRSWIDANSGTSPPVIEATEYRMVTGVSCFVQHCAQPTPKLCVDEVAGALPEKVGVIEIVVLVEDLEIVGEVLWRFEVVDVDVRPRRC